MTLKTPLKLRHAFGVFCFASSLAGAPTGRNSSSTAIIEQGKSFSPKACPAKLPGSPTSMHNVTSLFIKRMPAPPLSPQIEAANEQAARQMVADMADTKVSGAGQAEFNFESRAKQGWTHTAFDLNWIMTHIAGLAGLQKPEEGEVHGFHSNSAYGWLGEDWQNQNTGWGYQILLNAKLDILIGVSGYGPDGWDGGQRPRLPDAHRGFTVQHWSDMAYLMYAKQSKFAATDKANPGFFYTPPQWIYFSEARASDLTLEALQSSLNSQFEPGLRPKPGITFPIGTKAYDLMLSSPLVRSAADFLSQHRYRFGPSIIASITIWDSGATTQDGTQVPDILMYV